MYNDFMIQSQAISILKTGRSVFLTGEPGSGKTYILNRFIEYLLANGIEPAITASTGIAATHIGGMTIHSWSGIGIKAKLDRNDLNKIIKNQRIARRIIRTKILIIEEISMLTSDTLSMVDVVCRSVKQNQKPFGGMQVVLSGDFFQLPPIVKKEINNSQTTIIQNSLNHFAYNSHAWKLLNPTVCYITEQYRQEDKNFLDLLSAIRQNTINKKHLFHIKTRKIINNAIPNDIPKLYSHNADVDRINNEILSKLSGEKHVYRLFSQGPEALIFALKKGCLSPESLCLKVGAAVMFTKNNQKEKFVNGTLGVVEKFDKLSGNPIIKLKNGRHIEVEPMDWTIEENGKIRAMISQLPLRLAWAITVHKSQGMSLEEAVMDLSDVFEFGQGYVALSRVRRLTGLYILGWNDQAFKVNPEVLVKDTEFKNASIDTETKFSKIPISEIQKMQDDFIKSCDGKQKFIKSNNTLEETLLSWNQGKNISEIAKIRGLKEGTILDHTEKLVLKGKINRSDLSRILTKPLSESLPKIHEAFRKLDTDKLSPIFEKFKGSYSYEELRIARLLLKK
jgi:ATP-dependent exoDNAse (exonuclease V) alpha subunit